MIRGESVHINHSKFGCYVSLWPGQIPDMESDLAPMRAVVRLLNSGIYSCLDPTELCREILGGK